MPVWVLQAIAWLAQNYAVPVFNWLLRGAERSIERHIAARKALDAKKKGALPTTEADGKTP